MKLCGDLKTGKIYGHIKAAAAALFLLAALLGLLLVDRCGIGVDEATERRTLDVNIRAYVELFTGQDSASAQAISEHKISEWRDRDYGQAKFYPVWPVMHALEQQGCIRGMENAYHYYMYLLFLLGLFALYSIVRRLTGSRGAGLLAAGLLYLNPRFFAEAFYNNKDVVLLSLCLVVFWAGLVFIQSRSWLSCVAFGLAGAVAANSRILGLAAFGLCGIVYLVVYIGQKRWTKRCFWRGFAAVASLLVFFILLTPACWSGFFDYWKYLILGTANFDAARWNGWILYRGGVYNPVENPVPWHYIPWLMAITTPLLVLLLAALWPVQLILRCKKSREQWLSTETLFSLGLTVFFAAPLMYAMLARPNLYNSWRHLYFIYAPVVILAAVSAFWLWQSRGRVLRRVLTVVLAAHFVFYAGYIGINFPHEFAYFNVLAGAHPEQRYDADYWNIAQRTVMEKLQTLNPEFRAVPAQADGMLSWNWYQLKDALPTPLSEHCEEVQWDRRARAQYVAQNASYWKIWQLHPGWDLNNPAVQQWVSELENQQPIFTVKCGRTVLWQVYENPEFAG